MIDAAYFIKRHSDGVLNYTSTKITNNALKGINSIIQAVKHKVYGYGTTNYFISMVYLVCSDLDFNFPIAFIYFFNLYNCKIYQATKFTQYEKEPKNWLYIFHD